MARHALNEARPGRPRPEDPRPDGAWRHAGAGALAAGRAEGRRGCPSASRRRLYLRGTDRAALTPYAAPARLEDFSGLPPAYSFVGDGEPFYAETVHYFERLRAAGVPAQLDVYHCDMHAFDMMRPQDARSVEAAETLNRQFAYARAHYFAPQREADDGEGRVR